MYPGLYVWTEVGAFVRKYGGTVGGICGIWNMGIKRGIIMLNCEQVNVAEPLYFAGGG